MNETARELAREYPLLWKMATDFDFAERLGGCSDPLMAEADSVLRELWMARCNRDERQAALDSVGGAS